MDKDKLKDVEQLDRQLAEVIARALRLTAEQVNLSSSAGTLEEWDSLAHLQVILEIEQSFEVQFSTEEIPLLTSAQQLQDALAKKGVL